MDIATLTARATGFGGQQLLTLPDGASLSLKDGYIPLLTDFTFEDKAAKGLRKRSARDKPEPPVFFSALEVVRDNRILFLAGPSGSGKTTFARHLCFQLASSSEKKSRLIARNDFGYILEERWSAATVIPCYFGIQETSDTLRDLVITATTSLSQSLAKAEELLIVVDSIENAGDEAPVLLEQLIALAEGLSYIRLLVLSDINISRVWALPSGISRHNLLPLLETQRKESIAGLFGVKASSVTVAIGTAASNPAIFAIALQVKELGENAEEVVDSWLSAFTTSAAAADKLSRDIFERMISNNAPDIQGGMSVIQPKHHLLTVRAIQNVLAARHLAMLSVELTADFYQINPLAVEPVMKSVINRLSASSRNKTNDLAKALIRDNRPQAQRGALLLSGLTTESRFLKSEISTHLLAIIKNATLSIGERQSAGRFLSRLGDPRNYAALAYIPAGTFIFGSNSHPNSQPESSLTLPSFRIGIYPVVNQEYTTFVQETGRHWPSPDGLDPERRNAPATDLTWHDARAYCVWLTDRWRVDGTISSTELVRLPTEPEWERAATGDIKSSSNSASPTGTDPIYPWETAWLKNAANSEETGLNTTCTVGLFPSGRSPYGCYDMAGNVWEWCTTLWGENMNTPSFQYPWREDDGREALDAPGSIRRVLRGGCFSSGKEKACGTYRGSLEPDGFWRGNGFRIVVDEEKRV